MKRNFRSFEDAQEFVRELGLQSKYDWKDYCKSGNKPDDVPSSPDQTYKNKGWNGYGDWLGTGRTRSKAGNILLSFEKAREFVRKLNLKGQKEWLEYCASGNRPNNIPSDPRIIYKNEWKGIADWVGTEFHSFTEARTFVQTLNLTSQGDWQVYCNSDKNPKTIPKAPDKVYKNKGWIGWKDYLGYTTIRKIHYTSSSDFLPFENAREFARKLGLKNYVDWQIYCKSGNKPDNIPSNPNGTYKKDFKGYGDWLGTGNIASQNRSYRSFKDAREFVRKLQLKKQIDWFEYCKSGNKPDNIPSTPQRTYKNKGWVSHSNWLDIKQRRGRTGESLFLSFKDAREFVRKLGIENGDDWKKYCASGNKPNNIPSNPWSVYKKQNKKSE